MSVKYGTFLGVGYIITEPERKELMKNLSSERYNEIIDNMFVYRYDEPLKWFLGERLFEFDALGEAKSLGTLAALPMMDNVEGFGEKYGPILTDFGLSAQEIYENWSIPKVYIITYCEW